MSLNLSDYILYIFYVSTLLIIFSFILNILNKKERQKESLKNEQTKILEYFPIPFIGRGVQVNSSLLEQKE